MRHAFLIIAHNNPEILYAQLEILDSVDVDFYFHLDAKMKVNKLDLESHALKSKIYYIKPKKIRWGHYSQIECELRLLEAAVNSGKGYDYYHLLSGVDMPLKSYQDIDAFFKKNSGKEYIHFDEKTVDENVRERISMYHFCPGRANWQRKINGIFIRIQKMLKVDRLKKLGWKVQKGANWFSITEGLAKEIVRNKEMIQKHFKSDTAPAGQIIQQEPSADTVLKAGETIRLVVSKGPQMAEMPNIIGFTQDSAVKELEARGLVASCFMVVNDGSYASGCVVRTSEEPGTKVEVGTVITVYIAADPSVQSTVTPEEPAATEPTTTEPAPPETTDPTPTEYNTD